MASRDMNTKPIDPKTRGSSSFEAARQRSENAAEGGDHSEIQFEEGFTGKVMIGAIFVCLIMLPGAIYLGLVAGQSLGSAAQWVTIVLFSEVARRSFIPLKRQEIYCLFYMAGALTATGFTVLPGVSGGPFGGLIGMQYLIQAPVMHSVATHLPSWVAPHLGSEAYTQRNLFNRDWYLPIFWSPIPILLFTNIFDRMKWMGLGYVLFRITSDVERLPFPMAPVAASGATALAEASSKEDSWRWHVFSIGTIIGLVFGFIYLAIPIFTSVAIGKRIAILPIPFFDYTTSIERVLPSALMGYNPDLGVLMTGFIIPFPVAVGGFVSSILAQVVANPILHSYGLLPNWLPGSDAVSTSISNNFDFWMSFSVGLQLAVALIGLGFVGSTLMRLRGREATAGRGSLSRVPKGRGDVPILAALSVWLLATVGYLVLNHQLIPEFPFWIILFYGLIWTPMNSYVTARMIALTGQQQDFPYLNQMVVLGSHYQKPDVWFAPLPLSNYGPQAQKFRELELTGTKFTSILKLELFMLPLILAFSALYWGFLWHTNDIPSSQFPYAQRFWPQFAIVQSIWSQINAAGAHNWAAHAIKGNLIVAGGAIGLALYAIMALVKAPLFFFYGFVGGIGNYPHNAIPTFIGALLGRYYFAKKLGLERWQLYTPVLLAGFACGVGLMGMAGIALALISKSVNYLPF